jgi:glyoxylase-like metal-dependent hydrolase (beta-lactamase superfamily II)
LRGPLTAIDLAVPGEGGGSIRARVGGGSSLLLDTGFPNQLVLTQSDRTALLTHTHNDHAGGFRRRDLYQPR